MQRIFYRFNDIQTDTIVDVGGTVVSPALTPKQWVDNNSIGTWYIQLSAFGEPMLCTDYPELQDLPIIAFDGTNQYTIKPSCEFIKGRPNDR